MVLDRLESSRDRPSLPRHTIRSNGVDLFVQLFLVSWREFRWPTITSASAAATAAWVQVIVITESVLIAFIPSLEMAFHRRRRWSVVVGSIHEMLLGTVSVFLFPVDALLFPTHQRGSRLHLLLLWPPASHRHSSSTTFPRPSILGEREIIIGSASDSTVNCIVVLVLLIVVHHQLFPVLMVVGLENGHKIRYLPLLGPGFALQQGMIRLGPGRIGRILDGLLLLVLLVQW